VKRADDNLWDTLLGFVSGGARFFMTGNSYIGYNSGAGNWIDLNHPNDVQPGYIATGKWQLVTLTISKTAITLYVNGTVKKFTKVNGKLDGTDITAEKNFNYQLILDLLASSETFCLGKGSFWGSADARFDDVIVYNRALKFSEVLALNRMENRVYDFGQSSLDAIGQATGIQPPRSMERGAWRENTPAYDLLGRRINISPSSLLPPHSSKKTIIISNGKKYLSK
jgi:arabinan endo-1,5-alpha-L-arabinosidase